MDNFTTKTKKYRTDYCVLRYEICIKFKNDYKWIMIKESQNELSKIEKENTLTMWENNFYNFTDQDKFKSASIEFNFKELEFLSFRNDFINAAKELLNE